MILDFADWRFAGEQSRQTSTNFRPCTQEDMVRVLEIVETISTRQAKMGWYDQYLSLMNGPNVKDVVLGIENDTVIAIALTYTPSCGSQIASNLPWAGRIGNDVGGVTCMCISRKYLPLLASTAGPCLALLLLELLPTQPYDRGIYISFPGRDMSPALL
jgi:hypothetical protein